MTINTRLSSYALLVAAVAAVGGCAVGEETSTGSAAACAAREVFVDPASVSPGETVTVEGVGFIDGCEDNPEEVDGVESSHTSTSPDADIPVMWMQGDSEVELARIDADSDGQWTAEVSVPFDATSGSAEIGTGSAQSAAVTVTSASTA